MKQVKMVLGEDLKAGVKKAAAKTKESAKIVGEKISDAAYDVADICRGNDDKAFVVSAAVKTAAWFAGAVTIAGAVSLGEKIVYGRSLGGKVKMILTYTPIVAAILTASSAAEALIKNKKDKGVWHFPKVVGDKVITTDLGTEPKSE